ncbi:hypothetical protein C8R44DRAFT_731876 [Mycena epipterygia]|nr:hypothetical protein C8R44DRAFT_731876 [Mycena epipterygia]
MFHKLLIATLAAIALAQVHAVDVCSWSDDLSCGGVATCCLNLPANQCCGNVAQGFGFSVSYSNLPGLVSDGQAWTSSDCGAGGIVTQQIGTGTKCWRGAGTKAGSTSWTNHASKRSVGECLTPNVFKFTHNGVQKAVQIPSDDGALDKLVGFAKAGNFSALAAYPPA